MDFILTACLSGVCSHVLFRLGLETLLRPAFAPARKAPSWSAITALSRQARDDKPT
jgi:hypothetical protein